MNNHKRANLGQLEVIVALIGIIFVIAVGVILMSALYPVNPFMAIVGIILLIIVAIAMVVGLLRGSST